tara:strand:+ start:236 stop:358 length:123 start_codon:yes stop_codon:yes gene_type:complete
MGGENDAGGAGEGATPAVRRAVGDGGGDGTIEMTEPTALY